MKNTFGQSISVSIFGESHGKGVGAVLDGIAPGIKIDTAYINSKLAQRKPYGKISTARHEEDEFEILSGEFNGYTTGAPLTVFIKNSDTHSKDYSKFLDVPRPSHADFTAELKYHGFQDYRGGGHFSGRLTAPLVAVGAILQSALKDKGILIGTHIKSLAGISDRSFENYGNDIAKLGELLFPVLDNAAGEEMKKKIQDAASEGDSVGGILESAVTGLPGGVGEPFFDSLESIIAHAIFSVPGVKGVSFGKGFDFGNSLGSNANDSFYTDGKAVFTKTNNNGGINGGISNGMPLIINSAIKPTPSIFKEQKSVSLSALENTDLKIEGRHDPAIIHRARAVVDAVIAIALSDMLALRYGTDWLMPNKE